MRDRNMSLERVWMVVVAASLATGCGYETPAAHFTSAQVNTIAFDSIRQYANTLHFDTVLYAADVRHVTFDSASLRIFVSDTGDSARIEPEEGTWKLDSGDLAKGRIIARIWTLHPHAAFGYGPWWTWWWVDKQGGQWRSLYLSDHDSTRVADSLRVDYHLNYVWRQSLARWGSAWGTCGINMCCLKT